MGQSKIKIAKYSDRYVFDLCDKIGRRPSLSKKIMK